MRRRAWMVLSFLVLPALVVACPTCKDALGDNPESLGFAKGIYITVVGMLGMVFSLAGFFIYKIVQQAKKETQAGEPGQAPSA